MGITSKRLKELGLIDQVVPEPLGGSHRDVKSMALNLKNALLENLEYLERLPLDKLIDQRYQRLMNFGNFNEA